VPCNDKEVRIKVSLRLCPAHDSVQRERNKLYTFYVTSALVGSELLTSRSRHSALMEWAIVAHFRTKLSGMDVVVEK
jgi:hypothetical protein